MENMNMIALLSGMLAWGVVGILAYRMYKKQVVKPKIWIMPIIIIVSVFSVSINLMMVEISILPLGVWILYFIFINKEEQWKIYRSFAWLGFLANFIFLAFTLVQIPVHHVIYPKNEPATYIANVENAALNPTHPLAKDRSVNVENLTRQLETLKQEKIHSDQWYEETLLNDESKKVDERFPYQLIGISPKFGSDLHAIVYVEADGQGLLITTSKKQLYFRSEGLLVGEGDDDDKK